MRDVGPCGRTSGALQLRRLDPSDSQIYKYISLKWGKHTEHCFPRVSRTTLVAFDDKPSIDVPISRDIWQTVLYSP